MSPDIAVPMMVFGLPVAIIFIKNYFRFREKQLEAGSGNVRLLAASNQEYEKKQKELESRIENLESILIDLDSDLEKRLEERKSARPNSLGKPSLEARALPEKRENVE